MQQGCASALFAEIGRQIPYPNLRLEALQKLAIYNYTSDFAADDIGDIVKDI